VKLRFLDGLRGLAALIVVIDHFAIGWFQAATDGSIHLTHGAFESAAETTPLHLFVSGNFSVCVFFILSGIVLSAKFFRSGEKSFVIASAIKRYPRLMLPVLGCVLLAFFLMVTHVFYNAQAASLTGSTWLGSFWQFNPNFFDALYQGVIGTFVKGSSDYNTVLWTMKTELIGSFLVFGLLLVAGKFRYRYLVYLVLGLLLIKTYYVAFVLGIALSDAYFRNGTASRARMHWGLWVPLVLASVFLASCPVGTLDGTLFHYAQGHMPLALSVTITSHIFGAFGLIVAILYAPALQYFLIKKPLLYLGKISFALYLTHLYVIGSFSSYLFARIAPGVGYRIGFFLMLIPSAALIWLAAHYFDRFVDEPAIRLSSRIYRRFFQTNVERSAPITAKSRTA